MHHGPSRACLWRYQPWPSLVSHELSPTWAWKPAEAQRRKWTRIPTHQDVTAMNVECCGRLWRLTKPYRGAAPALTDLLGGQVTAMFADTPVLLPHIRAGKLKPIGAASASRNPLLPDVATLAEQGFPDTVADNWYGLLAPAKTPPAIVAKLHDAVVAVLEAPDVRETLLQSGALPARTGSAEFGKILSDELARWGRVVREKSIKED